MMKVWIVVSSRFMYYQLETCANRRGCTWALHEESSNTRIGFGLGSAGEDENTLTCRVLLDRLYTTRIVKLVKIKMCLTCCAIAVSS